MAGKAVLRMIKIQKGENGKILKQYNKKVEIQFEIPEET